MGVKVRVKVKARINKQVEATGKVMKRVQVKIKEDMTVKERKIKMNIE